MSSARKRAAIHKANKEAEYLRQKLAMVEGHYRMMKAIAERLAAELDALRAKNSEL